MLTTFPHRVLQRLVGDVLHFGQAELFALIHVRTTRQGEHQQRERACTPLPRHCVDRPGQVAQIVPLHAGGLLARQTRHMSRDVVVRQHPGGRGADGAVLAHGGIHHGTQFGGDPGASQEVEVERRVQFVVTHVHHHACRVRHPCLGDEDARRVVRVGQLAPRAIDLVHLVPVPVRVVGLVHTGDGLEPERQVPPRALADVGQTLLLDERVGHVDAEPVDSTIEPEPQRGEEVVANLGVRPVEVGLLGCEQVQVPLPGRAVRFDHACPCGTTEGAVPVVGPVVTIGADAIAEDVSPTFRRSGRCGQCLLEPHVLIGRVVGHDVEQHAQTARVRSLHERDGIVERAEPGLDRSVVAHVVAGIGERRRIPRVDPDRVDTEPGDVVEMRVQAGDVTEPVAVGIGETADVHLVDDGAAPPLLLLLHAGPIVVCAGVGPGVGAAGP